jgi:arylsulfatase A-like enzyme
MRAASTAVLALTRIGLLACLSLVWWGGILGCSKTETANPNGAQGVQQAAPATQAPAVLHLADLTEEAECTTAVAPRRTVLQWSFAEPRPEWLPVTADRGSAEKLVLSEQLADGLRLLSNPGAREFGPPPLGIFTKLDNAVVSDWGALIVRARTKDRFSGIGVACNVDDRRNIPGAMDMFMAGEHTAPVFSDGSAQEYQLPLPLPTQGEPLKNIGIFFGAMGAGSVDVLEVKLVPRGAEFAESLGSRPVTRKGETRHTLFAHAPARLTFTFDATAAERLDFALTCLPGETVKYSIEARRGSDAAPQIVFEETCSESAEWLQRSVDLRPLRDATLQLSLCALGAARDGAAGLSEAGNDAAGVALFGSLVVSCAIPQVVPNVIFYVIDGGGADEMSLYRYGRPTTPFLEELAKEGVVFEHAYANATWTQPSTVSFMTSLQHSVLGGLRRGVHSTPVPDAAVTFAEHMRHGGWMTASFSANPNAGRVIGLERGMDVQSDDEPGSHSTSSLELHGRFWNWRKQYPGTPYWVHFQTTDVHEPNHPVAPFAGLYVPKEQAKQLDQWEDQLWQAGGDLFGTTSITAFYDQALERAGIDRQAFFGARRGLYDETMHHQDLALRQLVDQLKADGEWENTLLVIGSDHGHPAGTFARWGRGLFDPQPAPWEGALFDSFSTRVPLLFVAPGRLPQGKRMSNPVSMIDVMPTVLDLCGLPMPEICQGRSLAPLMRGETEEHPPVVLDEFRIDEHTGRQVGNLEMIDGRFGASLEIGPDPSGNDTERGRYAIPAGGRWGAVHPYFPEAPKLLLYDLEKDPFALRAVNDQYPEQVDKYEQLLRALWESHQALGTQFQAASRVALSPEQLETLKNLGYIR